MVDNVKSIQSLLAEVETLYLNLFVGYTRDVEFINHLRKKLQCDTIKCIEIVDNIPKLKFEDEADEILFRIMHPDFDLLNEYATWSVFFKLPKSGV